MTQVERFHYRTNDAVVVTVTDPAGDDIPDTLVVKAGLGTSWRPPAEASLVTCSWVSAAGPERDFALRVQPSSAPVLAPDTYSVWFRLSGPGVDPLAPLIRAAVQVLIYGGPE